MKKNWFGLPVDPPNQAERKLHVDALLSAIPWEERAKAIAGGIRTTFLTSFTSDLTEADLDAIEAAAERYLLANMESKTKAVFVDAWTAIDMKLTADALAAVSSELTAAPGVRDALTDTHRRILEAARSQARSGFARARGRRPKRTAPENLKLQTFLRIEVPRRQAEKKRRGEPHGADSVLADLAEELGVPVGELDHLYHPRSAPKKNLN
jgi:cytidylate kinase